MQQQPSIFSPFSVSKIIVELNSERLSTAAYLSFDQENAMYASNCTPTSIRVYRYYVHHADSSSIPSALQVAEALSITEGTVRNAISLLTKLGYYYSLTWKVKNKKSSILFLGKSKVTTARLRTALYDYLELHGLTEQTYKSFGSSHLLSFLQSHKELSLYTPIQVEQLATLYNLL